MYLEITDGEKIIKKNKTNFGDNATKSWEICFNYTNDVKYLNILSYLIVLLYGCCCCVLQLPVHWWIYAIQAIM